ERIAARRIDLDYEAEFLAVGASYSEADEDGHVVVRATRDNRVLTARRADICDALVAALSLTDDSWRPVVYSLAAKRLRAELSHVAWASAMTSVRY
ncbi:MAG: hypothetical protein JWN22_1086, partial [Nocardioides sp.]|nr:hypothetical protein [Nocardioides sp.]